MSKKIPSPDEICDMSQETYRQAWRETMKVLATLAQELKENQPEGKEEEDEVVSALVFAFSEMIRSRAAASLLFYLSHKLGMSDDLLIKALMEQEVQIRELLPKELLDEAANDSPVH